MSGMLSATDSSNGKGLSFRLSQGAEVAPTAAALVPQADTEPLSGEDVRRVLSRLPPLEARPEDARDFALPQSSLPPPQTGTELEAVFPPAEEREACPQEEESDDAPKVWNYAPQGGVDFAHELTVLFSQPMVALASQDALTTDDPPVKLSPQPPGRWRWLDTQTLIFEPEKRFPMASRFEVEIPAGTQSAAGRAIEETTRWSFATPPPRVVNTFPVEGSHPCEPVVFVGFDQQVEPESVLPHITATADRRQSPPFSFRLATPEEIDGDAAVKSLADAAPPGTWLAVRPTEPMPRDSRITVHVGKKTPGCEGPLTGADATAK